MKMSIFGRVERAAALVERVGHAVLVEALAQLLLGPLPELVGADAASPAASPAWRAARSRTARTGCARATAPGAARRRPGRRGRRRGESSCVSCRTRNMPARTPVRSLRKSDAVVGEAHRQLAIRPRPGAVDQDLLRAVHRLQAGDVVVVVEDEHVVLVVAPVAGRLPQLLAHQARRADLVEAAAAPHLARPLLERSPDGHAARMEERGGRRLGVEGEQVELAAELAVVALLGLLEAPQVLVQLVGRVPGRAVDALEHRARLVATPVGAGGVQQLEGAQLPGRAEVPAAAQVLERPVAVEADGRAVGLGQVVDDLDLEGLSLRVSSATASARGRSFECSNARSAACCSRIFASICSRSAGVSGRGRSKS